MSRSPVFQVAYWIAILFAEGSLLFCIGTTATLFRADGWVGGALVTGSYFTGSVAFALGA